MTRKLQTLGALFFAAALHAQTAKPVLGTVTEFKANAFEMAVKPDTGDTVFVRFGPETEVVQVPPGQHDLSHAAAASVTAILAGDRVMVSFAPGMTEARRIVLITSRDIAKRNEAEKLDWQKRGISGSAVSQKGNEITVGIRTPQGTRTAVIAVSETTRIRRYAPDSVKFSEAIPGTLVEIAPGDQVRARGLKSEDGSALAAEEVVFGTFLTRLGPVTAIDRETGEIRIQDVITKQPLTVRLIADSQLKMMPDMRAMMAPRPAGHSAPPPREPANFDLQATIERLPAARIEDLKIGGGVVVTSTKGSKPDTVTAIMLLANADFLVQLAGPQPAGENGMDAISRLHGGMLVGPNGLSLPTMIQ